MIGRGTKIRTLDLRYPKPPRYQAALYPANAVSIHLYGGGSKVSGSLFAYRFLNNGWTT